MTNINTFNPDIISVNDDGGVSLLSYGENIAAIDASKKSNASFTALNNRNINTTAPLTGGGNLTADRTLSITGLTIVITTAKLTPGGANGSMTFTSGVLTAQTAAT